MADAMLAKQNIFSLGRLLAVAAITLVCIPACQQEDDLPKIQTVYQAQGREAYLIEASLEEVARYRTMLYKPSDFKVIDDSSLVVIDRDEVYGGIKKLDLKTNDVSLGGGLGDQPGQVAYVGTTSLHQFSNGDLWVYDTGLRRGSIFSRDLEFKTHFEFTKTFSAGPINDSTIAVIPTSKDTLIQMHRLNGARHLGESPVLTIGVEDEALKPLQENPILRYGLIESADNHLFVGFDFSSLLLRVSDSEIVFKTFEPEGLPFPNSSIGRQPDVADFPPTTLDIATDQDYVYILFSGKQVTKTMFLEYSVRDNLDGLFDEIKRSNRVFILDKQEGSFVGEIVLPVQADQIDVTPEYVFALSTDEIAPTIFKYSRPKRWA